MKRLTSTVAAFAALTIVAAACSSDKKTETTAASSSSAPTTAGTSTAPATTSPASTAPANTTAAPTTATGGTGAAVSLDTNGDGKVIIGVATPGPRNDGAYYQALVDQVTKLSKDKGYADPIIVDNIKPEEAQTQLDSLARQNVDMIAVGAGEIADPLPALTATYAKVIWYCNCGASVPPEPNLIQSGDDGSEMGYSAGVATGLLMKDKGATKAAMIGANNFNFEKEAFASFKLGLASIDPSYEWTYVATGSFNDVAAATEAFNNLKDQGVGAVWPYLGGSHEAVVKLADDAGIIALSAGASKVCQRTDLSYQIAVRFDAGDYLSTIFDEILSGKLKRGDTRTFHVGVDPQGGALICKPTADQTSKMDAAYKLIASGSLKPQFDQVKKDAYSS